MKKLFNEYLYQQAQDERIEAHLIQEQTAEFPIKILLQERRTLLIHKQGQAPTSVALW